MRLFGDVVRGAYFAAVIELVVLVAEFVVIAVAFKLDFVGPRFYNSVRVGRKGKTSSFLNFRAMAADAGMLMWPLCHLKRRDGVLVKIPNDLRITLVQNTISAKRPSNPIHRLTWRHNGAPPTRLIRSLGDSATIRREKDAAKPKGS